MSTSGVEASPNSKNSTNQSNSRHLVARRKEKVKGDVFHILDLKKIPSLSDMNEQSLNTPRSKKRLFEEVLGVPSGLLDYNTLTVQIFSEPGFIDKCFVAESSTVFNKAILGDLQNPDKIGFLQVNKAAMLSLEDLILEHLKSWDATRPRDIFFREFFELPHVKEVLATMRDILNPRSLSMPEYLEWYLQGVSGSAGSCMSRRVDGVPVVTLRADQNSDMLKKDRLLHHEIQHGKFDSFLKSKGISPTKNQLNSRMEIELLFSTKNEIIAHLWNSLDNQGYISLKRIRAGLISGVRYTKRFSGEEKLFESKIDEYLAFIQSHYDRRFVTPEGKLIPNAIAIDEIMELLVLV